jgi:hypothetical protein
MVTVPVTALGWSGRGRRGGGEAVAEPEDLGDSELTYCRCPAESGKEVERDRPIRHAADSLEF